MSTSWMLQTDGDPLTAVRQFLKGLWLQADLEGMLIPVYQADGTVTPRLIQDAVGLTYADPFTPLEQMNAARAVAQLARARPQARMAAVLRPCEVRALAELARRDLLDLDPWLIIGVDCLATYERDDYAWRLQKVGSPEQLTRDVLRFARQGGIAPYRFRQACQMCTAPGAEGADINICLLGMPAQTMMLVTANLAMLAEPIDLAPLLDNKVRLALVRQHRDVLTRLGARRRRARDRATADLPDDAPTNIEALMAQFFACALADPPCHLCQEACPLCGEFGLLQNGAIFNQERMSTWVAACVGCGMCEASCPQHQPLTAIIGRISRSLQGEAALA